MAKWTEFLEAGRAAALEAGRMLRAGMDEGREISFKGTVDLVTNFDRQQEQVVVHRIAPDGARQELATRLTWPRDLVSLGHVALPFPPDDPVYGFRPGSGRGGIPSIGSWLLRGESGATTISLGSLTRLRSNPFWSLIDQEIGEYVAADRVKAR